MLFGIFVGLSSAFAVDTLDRTVTDPLEVEEITGKPVIGVIPIFGEKGRTYGARLAHGAQRLTGMRTAIPEEPATSVWMLERPDSVPRKLSGIAHLDHAFPRRRRTQDPPGHWLHSRGRQNTVTANLAVAFAQHNKKVLIIEADMRRPKLKHKMDFPAEVGLSNVLAGSCSADDAIIRGLYVPTLDVLPAGPRPPMPSEILGSAAFDELLNELSARYDIILIDSPPALVVTDAVTISTEGGRSSLGRSGGGHHQAPIGPRNSPDRAQSNPGDWIRDESNEQSRRRIWLRI